MATSSDPGSLRWPENVHFRAADGGCSYGCGTPVGSEAGGHDCHVLLCLLCLAYFGAQLILVGR